MTHTPGPWEISKCPKENGAKWLDDICIYAGVKEVARIKRSENYDWSVAIGNATLIAAAPVLMSELKEVVRIFESYGHQLRHEDNWLACNSGAFFQDKAKQLAKILTLKGQS